MENIIARRYAKAIASRADINDFYQNLCILNSAFVLPKFKNIIESNEIKKERKMEFLDSFFDIKNSSFQNFLRLLIENSRLECIPQIVKELERCKINHKNKIKFQALTCMHTKQINSFATTHFACT